jgi:hypothetical protein
MSDITFSRSPTLLLEKSLILNIFENKVLKFKFDLNMVPKAKLEILTKVEWLLFLEILMLLYDFESNFENGGWASLVPQIFTNNPSHQYSFY